MIRLSALMVCILALIGDVGAQSLPTIRVGWTIPDGETKYWMLKRPEEFPGLGKTYKIEWQQVQGTSVSAQALAAGALDCATLGVLPVAQGVSTGAMDLYIIAQHVGEKPGGFSVYWAVKEDSPIKTIADLKGKSVGINALGSGIQGPFALLLKRNGLDPDKDIKLVEVGFAIAEDAVRTGRVDAAAFVQPFAGRAESKGGLRKLLSLGDAAPNIVHLVEVCRKDFTDKNPDVVRAYIKDLTLAMNKTLSNRDETMKVVNETMKVPLPVLDTFLLKTNDFARPAGAAADYPAIQKLLDIYVDAGQVTKPVDVTKLKHPTLFAPIE
jgi:ABC-type nitrate/sulfonate/bicarbonate transport system substrate-binding protein